LDYYSNHRQDLIKFVPPSTKKLLDVGCGPGHTGRLCKQQGIEVYGVEIDSEAAAMAAEVLDGVICADLEVQELPWAEFDCILCGDVLEHMKDPWTMLNRMKTMLSPSGVIVASIPNVAHISVIRKLLTDTFAYEECGILDRTHLRFFTRSTILSLFSDSGYQAKIVGTNASCGAKHKLLKWLSFGRLGHCSVVQYLIIATPRKNEDE